MQGDMENSFFKIT